MIKKISRLAFWIAATMVFATSVIFAQSGSIHRILSIYASGDSGTLINGIVTDRDDVEPKSLFEGNELEFGVMYSQNFLNAQWLYFDANVATIATSGEVTNVVADSTTGTPQLQTVYKYTLPRVKGKLGLSGTLEPLNLDYFAFYALIDVVGLVQTLALEDHNIYLEDIEYGAPIELGVGYTFDFGAAGNLTLGLDLEFSAVPYTYAYVYENINTGVNWNGEVDRGISLLDINIAYNIPFATYLGYTTKLGFRFEGAGAMSDAYTKDISTGEIKTIREAFGTNVGTADDPIYTYAGEHLAFKQNFASSFAIRWDNTFDVVVNAFNMYATLRTQFDNLVSDITISNPLNERQSVTFTQDFSVVFKLILGASYTFDF